MTWAYENSKLPAERKAKAKPKPDAAKISLRMRLRDIERERMEAFRRGEDESR